MTELQPNSKFIVSEASNKDIPQLAAHHRLMFEDIWESRGEPIVDRVFDRLQRAYAEKLEKELTDGTCRAWVIRRDGTLLASGAITIISLVPTPSDVSSEVAYLHSIYTEKGFRKRGLANLIVARAVRHCQDIGITRVTLNASDAGKPIYEKIGFISAPDTMRFHIPRRQDGK